MKCVERKLEMQDRKKGGLLPNYKIGSRQRILCHDRVFMGLCRDMVFRPSVRSSLGAHNRRASAADMRSQ